jgi:hypothetical protein
MVWTHNSDVAQLSAIQTALHASQSTTHTTTVTRSIPTFAGPTVYATGSVNGHPCGGNLPNCCTLTHESHGTNAQNPYSSASGYWQFLTSTFDNVTGLSGPARNYSAAIQDAAAVRLYAGGAGWENWKGDGCYPGG